MTTGIELRKLRKLYEGHGQGAWAVDGVDMTIGSGKFITLLGPSGCGKTTTLRMIAGLEVPTSGQILRDGLDITDQPVTDRDMRMVFQDFALFPNMTVEQNVTFGLRVRRMRGRYSEAEIKKRVFQFLDLVHLADHAHKKPHQLSGGQKQRVGIARALAADPALLLSDEATSALDPETTRSILALLRDINRRLGLTILLITHEMEVIRSIADRVAVIDAGRIVARDPYAMDA